jgi:type IV pilus assembly protein PilQ
MSCWAKQTLIIGVATFMALAPFSQAFSVGPAESLLFAQNSPSRETQAAEASAPSPATTVTSVGVVKDPMGSIVSITGSGPMEYEYFTIQGTNVVVDIYDAVNEAWPTIRKVDGAFLRQVRIGEHFKPRRMVRVLLELDSATDYRVRDEGQQIIVTVGTPGARPEQGRAGEPPTGLITDIRYLPARDKSRVEIAVEGEPEYSILDTGDPQKIVLMIENVQLAPTARKAIDLADLERALRRVDASEEFDGDRLSVRLIAQLTRAVPYRVSPGPAGLYLDVDHAPEASFVTPAVTPRVAGKGVHRGRKVSLDFVDADIRDILRLISDVAGINFAAGSEVKGRVSIRLIDVPWETALETLLITNTPPLVQVPVAENVVRITTEDKVLREEEQRQKKVELQRRRLQAEKELEEEKPPPIITREFTISYAKLGEEGQLLTSPGSLLGILQTFTTKWNDLFTADPRTNTIIVRDSAESIKDMEAVIRKLDTPTYAVVVEARIVEVNEDVSDSLGIRWNANFAADAAHGNALPFNFPNSVSIGGAASGGQTGGPFMVTLPAANPTAAVGLSFGHIANTFSLDLQLSAMEELGKTKILSSPKILVVQNEKASINIGDKLPIPQTDAEGNRTVDFEATGIRLEVVPQVTNDGRVFMDIHIEKSVRGDTVQTTEGPMFSINSRDATTKVLVRDGETAVIGGIIQEESADNRGSVPGLSEIPLLGWMFRSKDIQERRTELMIFLTPRIIPAD